MNTETYDRVDGSGGTNGTNRGPKLASFLIKTLSIVNDPNTDSIISWNSSGDSFIIWDHHQFSTEIIPKYFKHNNFSSFIYQLNKYGFRKIGVEHRWEYENPNFQAGKEHLLTNIKRRIRERRFNHHAVEIINQTPTENLMNQMNESKLEIEKLRKQQEEMEFRITLFESEVKMIENQSERLMMCLAKACEQILAKKMREEKGDDDEAVKKRELEKFTEIQTEDSEKKDGNNYPRLEDCDGKDNQVQKLEKITEIRMEDNEKSDGYYPRIEDCDGKDNQGQEDTIRLSEHEAGLRKNSEDYKFWKNLLMEDDDEARDSGSGIREMDNGPGDNVVLDLEGVFAKLANQENHGEVINTIL